MHARDLVELAAVVISDSRRLWRDDGTTSQQALRHYWLASRRRQERWEQIFRLYRPEIDRHDSSRSRDAWQSLSPVLDEVLLSDVLTRVVAAVLTHQDHQAEPRVSSPPSPWQSVVRTVFLGHRSARHHALDLMLARQRVATSGTAGLNQLRRRCELWTDLLLAALVQQCDFSPYAVRVDRVTRLASYLGLPDHDLSTSATWLAIQATLRRAFPSTASSPSPNGDLNQQIAASVLDWLGQQPSDWQGMGQLPETPSARRAARSIWGILPRPSAGELGQTGRHDRFQLRPDSPDSGPGWHRFRRFR